MSFATNALQIPETKMGQEVVSNEATVAPRGALHDSGSVTNKPHLFFKEEVAPGLEPAVAPR